METSCAGRFATIPVAGWLADCQGRRVSAAERGAKTDSPPVLPEPPGRIHSLAFPSASIRRRRIMFYRHILAENDA
jgi:hypothetical protein